MVLLGKGAWITAKARESSDIRARWCERWFVGLGDGTTGKGRIGIKRYIRHFARMGSIEWHGMEYLFGFIFAFRALGLALETQEDGKNG